MRDLFLATLTCLLVVCGMPAGARAETEKQIAQHFYSDGKKLYDVGEYVKALEAFKRAYLASEDASFVYNMALCYRAMGDKPAAIRTYKSYLRNQPDASNRDDVERVVRHLEEELSHEQQAAATNRPPTPPPATVAASVPGPPTVAATVAAAPPPKKRARWIWPVVAGVVVVGAGVGLALGLTLGRPTEASLNKATFP